MGVFKCTMLFDGPKHGWTESYYQDLASNNYQSALSNTEALAERRAPLLGKQCKIIGARVSRVDRKNDGNSTELTLQGGSICDSDEPDACLVAICRDADFARHKMVFMRGIPDAIDVQFGQFVDVECDFRAKFQTWANYIGAPLRPWGWYGRPLTGPRRADLAGYVPVDGTGQVRLTFATPLFLIGEVAQRVTINLSGINAPSTSTLTGQVVVTIDSTTTCTTVFPYAVFLYIRGGVGLYIPSEFIPIRQCSPVKIGTRRVGAPLLNSRGRRSKRAKG